MGALVGRSELPVEGNWSTSALNSLTVCSTGDTKDEHDHWHNGGPQTYTLTTSEESIDLSSKNLGPADVALLTAWLQRPKARVTLAQVDVSDNRIDEACAKTLRAVAEKEGCEILGV